MPAAVGRSYTNAVHKGEPGDFVRRAPLVSVPFAFTRPSIEGSNTEAVVMARRIGGGSSLRLSVLAVLAVIAGLAVLPAAAEAAPSAVIAPDHGLVDGQTVTVTADGLPANTDIEVLQCAGTVQSPPADALSCDAYNEDTTGYSDIRGHFLDTPNGPGGVSGFTVRFLPAVAEHHTIIHCDLNSPCILYVGVNVGDFKAPHTFLPLNFAGSRT